MEMMEPQCVKSACSCKNVTGVNGTWSYTCNCSALLPSKMDIMSMLGMKMDDMKMPPTGNMSMPPMNNTKPPMNGNMTTQPPPKNGTMNGTTSKNQTMPSMNTTTSKNQSMPKMNMPVVVADPIYIKLANLTNMPRDACNCTTLNNCSCCL